MARSFSLSAAACVAASLLALACHRSTDDGISGVGTVEVTEADIAPMVSGRVTRVWVEEGAHVRAGDTLVTLTQNAIPANVDAQRGRLAAAEAQLRQLQAGARRPELERADADLRNAQAEADRTARDVERLAPLAAKQNVSAQQFDAAQTTARLAAGRRDAARETLRLLQQGARPQEIDAARANVASARAAVAGAAANQSELVLVAGAPGVVLSRHAEPGELLGAGQSALTLGDVTRPWVRIYVDQRALPRVHVGDPVTATLDAFPDKPVAGAVVSINTQAEYTPRVALTEAERADLLFGVKIALRDTTGMLKAGLPVTVRFTVRVTDDRAH